MQKKFKRLRMRMIESDMTQRDLAEAIEMAPSTLSARLDNKQPFTLWEVKRICTALNIKDDEMMQCFADGLSQ